MIYSNQCKPKVPIRGTLLVVGEKPCGHGPERGELGDESNGEKLLRRQSDVIRIPSGKHTRNYGKSPFFMGNITISMVIFHSYVKLPEGMGD